MFNKYRFNTSLPNVTPTASYHHVILEGEYNTPTPPFKIGEMVDDPLTMYLGDVYTIPVNLAGVTGLSIPCGFTRAGLPVGLQLIGGHFEEENVLRAAYAFQEKTDFHKKRPELNG